MQVRFGRREDFELVAEHRARFEHTSWRTLVVVVVVVVVGERGVYWTTDAEALFPQFRRMSRRARTRGERIAVILRAFEPVRFVRMRR